MAIELKEYATSYSPQLVMQVLNRAFSKAGFDVVARVLQLYYLAKSPELPLWAKASVFAALGYFVVSPDAMPDIVPVLGFTDDLLVITSTLAGLSSQITPEIQRKVLEKLQGWFGDEAAEKLEKIQQAADQEKT